MTAPSLADVLSLTQTGADLFDGASLSKSGKRIFGGLVLGQALAACSQTVTDRPAHSLHAYFILAGDPNLPVSYRVERLRDGKSFATRRCVASQDGRAIFELTASFQTDEPGLSRQTAAPDTPMPETLPGEAEFASQYAGRIPDSILQFMARERPVELRYTDVSRFLAVRPPPPYTAKQMVWMRVRTRLSDNPAEHRAALAYISDMTLLDCALAPLGRSIFDPALMVASLDHAIWFHRPFRADEWLLYSQESGNLGGGRGLARGQFFTRDGSLAASVAQEGLIRERT